MTAWHYSDWLKLKRRQVSNFHLIEEFILGFDLCWWKLSLIVTAMYWTADGENFHERAAQLYLKTKLVCYVSIPELNFLFYYISAGQIVRLVLQISLLVCGFFFISKCLAVFLFTPYWMQCIFCIDITGWYNGDLWHVYLWCTWSAHRHDHLSSTTPLKWPLNGSYWEAPKWQHTLYAITWMELYVVCNPQ